MCVCVWREWYTDHSLTRLSATPPPFWPCREFLHIKKQHSLPSKGVRSGAGDDEEEEEVVLRTSAKKRKKKRGVYDTTVQLTIKGSRLYTFIFTKQNCEMFDFFNSNYDSLKQEDEAQKIIKRKYTKSSGTVYILFPFPTPTPLILFSPSTPTQCC